MVQLYFTPLTELVEHTLGSLPPSLSLSLPPLSFYPFSILKISRFPSYNLTLSVSLFLSQ